MAKRIFTPINEIIPGANISGMKSVDEAQTILDESWKEKRYYGRPIFADYAGSIWGHVLLEDEVKEKMKELFKGQVIVDLGAGQEQWGYNIAGLIGARAYIGVEPFFPKQLEESIKREPFPKKMKTAIAPEDMLTFMERLPDNSISIILSGIDNLILRSNEYILNVKNEISRTLSPKGAVLYESHIPLPNNLQRVNVNEDNFIKIYSKPVHNHETQSSRIKIGI